MNENVSGQGYEMPVRGDSLAEQVYRQLCSAILSGAFAPQERINLRSLASDLQVSVTPVREAVLRLISDGVLQATEKNAIIVPEIRRPDLVEIFEIRCLLEGALAEAAAKKLDEVDLEFLRTTQHEFLEALSAKEYRSALRLNALLHFRIYRRAELPVRLKMVEALWLRIGPTLHHMYPILQRDRINHRSHETMIEQARRRDPQGLRKAVIADLNASEQALHQYLAQISHAQQRRRAGQRI